MEFPHLDFDALSTQGSSGTSGQATTGTAVPSGDAKPPLRSSAPDAGEKYVGAKKRPLTAEAAFGLLDGELAPYFDNVVTTVKSWKGELNLSLQSAWVESHMPIIPRPWDMWVPLVALRLDGQNFPGTNFPACWLALSAMGLMRYGYDRGKPFVEPAEDVDLAHITKEQFIAAVKEHAGNIKEIVSNYTI